METEKETFSGERFIPSEFSCDQDISQFHIQRYVFARKFVEKKVVLDIACGEGYGSFLLAENAKRVEGVDNSNVAINEAVLKYKKENLSFSEGDATWLGFDDAVFDVVISFETIEHLSVNDQRKFLVELRRVLKPGGLLVISTPDKNIYGWGYNPFHLHELSKKEFSSLLKKFFETNSLYAQDRRERSTFPIRVVRWVIDKARHSVMWLTLKKVLPKKIRERVDVSITTYKEEIKFGASTENIYVPREIRLRRESGMYLIAICQK